MLMFTPPIERSAINEPEFRRMPDATVRAIPHRVRRCSDGHRQNIESWANGSLVSTGTVYAGPGRGIRRRQPSSPLTTVALMVPTGPGSARP